MNDDAGTLIALCLIPIVIFGKIILFWGVTELFPDWVFFVTIVVGISVIEGIKKLKKK